jgi:diadenylate cyclase
VSPYLDFILELHRFLPFSVRDVIDIAIVAFITYRFLLLMRGTRGAQMTWGIVVLLLVYWVTRYYRLTAVQWLLSIS